MSGVARWAGRALDYRLVRAATEGGDGAVCVGGIGERKREDVGEGRD